DVAQSFLVRQAIGIVNFLGAVEGVVIAWLLLDEYAGQMCVALEAVFLHSAVNLLHLADGVNILRKDILVDRIARRAVDVEDVAVFVRSRQIAEKLPALFGDFASGDRGFELGPSPEYGAKGHVIEPAGVENRSLVVISQKRQLAVLHHKIDALARIWAIANH